MLMRSMLKERKRKEQSNCFPFYTLIVFKSKLKVFFSSCDVYQRMYWQEIFSFIQKGYALFYLSKQFYLHHIKLRFSSTSKRNIKFNWFYLCMSRYFSTLNLFCLHEYWLFSNKKKNYATNDKLINNYNRIDDITSRRPTKVPNIFLTEGWHFFSVLCKW